VRRNWRIVELRQSVAMLRRRRCHNREICIGHAMKYDTHTLRQLVDRRPGLAAALIFLAALAARAAVAVHLPARVVWSDGSRYMRIADHLLQQGTFGSLRDNQYSVPVQPLLLAAVRLLFGTDFLALRLCFAVLGAATCVVAYLLTRRLFGPMAALLAGLLLAFYPPYVYLSALFEYPQTFFILIIGLSFLALFEHLRTGGLVAVALCGLLLGVAILTVPTVQVFMPLLVVCLIVSRGALQMPVLIVLCIATAVPVGSWALRNYLQYGDPILVNRAGGFSFWTANNETYYEYGKQAVVPLCAGVNDETRFCKEFLEIRRELRNQDLTEAQRVAREDQAQWQKGIRFLVASPSRAARLTARKFLQFWTPVPDTVTNRDTAGNSAVTWISILSYTPALLLGLTGMLLSWRSWRTLVPVYAYFATFTAVYSVFLPTTRYRLPLDFFLIIFTAYALARCLQQASEPPPTARAMSTGGAAA
jgi:4-amino-4-deoxy-L-arabinose transferase-like glycosyltransferase